MSETQTIEAAGPDMERLERFAGTVMTDAGAALSVLLTHVGDRLGLYRAMADGEPVSAPELARRTATNERLVREWLHNQVAGGYIELVDGRFRLPLEHAIVLTDESSPAFLLGVVDLVEAVYRRSAKATEVFRTGSGLAWTDHDPALFDATERSFAPVYRTFLVGDWIAAVPGLAAKLTAGARIVDVGCGYGAPSILLAEAFPASTVLGLDYHEPSVRVARERARDAGIGERLQFRVADAAGIDGTHDLITFFDAWHDLADPLGAARAARASLSPDGWVLLVEPRAADALEDNINPLGRFLYGVSSLVCTPCSVSDGGPGLGTAAGEARTREMFQAAGFTRFDRVAETPQNSVYVARA